MVPYSRNIGVTAVTLAIAPTIAYLLMKMQNIIAPRILDAWFWNPISVLICIVIGLLVAYAFTDSKTIGVGRIGLLLIFGRLTYKPLSAGWLLYVGTIHELPDPSVLNEERIRKDGSDEGIPVVLKVKQENGPNGQITAKVKLALRFKVGCPEKLLPQLQLGPEEKVDWNGKHRKIAAGLVLAYILELARGSLSDTEFTSAQSRDYDFKLTEEFGTIANNFGIVVEDVVLTDVRLADTFEAELAQLATQRTESAAEAQDQQSFVTRLQGITAASRQADGSFSIDATQSALLALTNEQGINKSYVAVALALYGGLQALSGRKAQ